MMEVSRNSLPGEKGKAAARDYRRYHRRPTDILLCTAQALLLSLLISWLFYRSPWGMLVFVGVWPFLYWGRKRAEIKRQQQRLREQFKECIRVVTASLYSGYSVENAFLEAEKELTHLLGEKAEICRELRVINQQIRLNIPVEALLADLANRSGVEEIVRFGQVFGFAKRNGSDFARVLRETSQRIGDKIELERELQTMVAAKRLEQRIMNVIPIGILFFVDLTSPGFLQVMYSGVPGRLIMSLCLLVYGGAYLLSGKIVDIRI